MSGPHDNRRGLDRHVKRAKVVFSPTATFESTDSTGPSASPTDDPFATLSSSSSATPIDPAALTSASPTQQSTPSVTSTTPTTTSTSSSSSSFALSTPLTTPSSSSVTPIASVAHPVTSITRITYSPIQPSSSSSSATASATGAPTSSASTSAIVGGIAAGLVGLAGLIFATMFFMRRWRKRGAEENEFNADAFRRQSAILVDDETATYGGRGGGYNPRPPTMIERHIAGRTPFDPSPMPSLQQHHNRGPGTGGYGNEYDYPAAPQQSFSPGQVIPSPSSPPTVQTGMQFFAPYGQSPLHSPDPYDSAYNENGQLIRQPSSGAAIHNVQKQLSNGMHEDLSRQDSIGGDAHYVDLDRSSVTPFQAAQYAEISRQLGTKDQGGLNSVNKGGEQPHYVTGRAIFPEDNPNPSHDSPFADTQRGRDARQLVPSSPIYSMDSMQTSRDGVPSNSSTKHSDFQAQEHTFSPTSYDFPQTPSAIPSPSAVHFGITTAPSSKAGGRFPNGLSSEAVPHNQTNVAKGLAPKPIDQRPASTYTVYDEADAYGGF